MADERTQTPQDCPKGRDCAINKGAVLCFYCGRTWPPNRPWSRMERRAMEARRGN